MHETISLPDSDRCQDYPVASEAIKAAQVALQKRIARDGLKPETATIAVTCDPNINLGKVTVSSNYTGGDENETFGGTTRFYGETEKCRKFPYISDQNLHAFGLNS